MNWFESEKRKRNLERGYKEDKGLEDGHCNREACQAPLVGQEQWTMRDHELMTDGRLFYCAKCAAMFNRADAEMNPHLPQRCRLEKKETLEVGFAAEGEPGIGVSRPYNRHPADIILSDLSEAADVSFGAGLAALMAMDVATQPRRHYARTAREVVPKGKSKRKFKGSKAAKKAGRGRRK